MILQYNLSQECCVSIYTDDPGNNSNGSVWTLGTNRVKGHSTDGVNLDYWWGRNAYAYCCAIYFLIHPPLDKIAAISQTTCPNAFSWIDIFEFKIKFHWNMFLESNWQYVGIGSDNGLAPSRRQAIIWTNAHPINWRIYTALGGDELIHSVHICWYSQMLDLPKR